MVALLLAAALLAPTLLPQTPAADARRAPQVFDVTALTTKGSFVIEVHRDWSPHGADRFYDLVASHYYDDSRVFRAVPDKWVQFGIAGDPSVAAAWRDRTIPDDRVVEHNLPGYIAFANTGPGTRSSQVYINLGDNSAKNDREPGFAPFGKVVHDMAVVQELYSGYGETSGGGMRAGRQQDLFEGGDAYLDAHFPKLDKLISLRVTSPSP